MSDLAITYLTVDSVMEGVGRSQVLPYVERLPSRGVQVDLHSFERRAPDRDLTARLGSRGVRWHPHGFGRPGSIGGPRRVLAGARALRAAELVHARSTLPAASALLARSRPWVWDMRAFWADQRVALGVLTPGSPEERITRAVERRATISADAVVSLTAAAVPVLAERHDGSVAERVHVIPTCVDLRLFEHRPLAVEKELRFVLTGSLNAYYDVPAMLRFVDEVRRRRSATLRVFAPGGSPWDGTLAAAGARPTSVRFEEVPATVWDADAGLAVCRFDAGVSLRAAMPTKIAEYLACGRPVVVNGGLGDMDELLRTYRCGVLLQGGGGRAIAAGAAELLELLDDPGLSARCRALAEDHFDLERAVDALAEVYRKIA